MASESWDLGDHQLEGATRPSKADSPADGDASSPGCPRRTGLSSPASGFSPALSPPDQSWGINCAHTAIIPTNSAIDASAAASSTKVLNIARSLELEHRRNIVPFLFSKSTRAVENGLEIFHLVNRLGSTWRNVICR
jgi:hypothetical protein